MNKNSEISFYVDSLIVEALLSNKPLSKTAQGANILMQIINKVKDYVGNHITDDDKVGSVINMFAPGVVYMTLGAMGLGGVGKILSLAMVVFDVDVSSIFHSITEKLKGPLNEGKLLTSQNVDGIVSSSVQSAFGTSSDQNQAISYAQMMRDVRMVKLSMIEYDLYKSGKYSFAGASKAKTGSVLAMVLGWILKAALASAGLMVAGDIIKKLLGMPNALDGPVQKGKAVKQIERHTPTQTKFKLQPSYQETEIGNWTENISNTQSPIEEMVVSYAKQVYQGLDGLENIIKSTPGFQVIVNRIVSYNQSSTGDPVVFIPKDFVSKKQMVDFFIDDVAEKAK